MKKNVLGKKRIDEKSSNYQLSNHHYDILVVWIEQMIIEFRRCTQLSFPRMSCSEFTETRAMHSFEHYTESIMGRANKDPLSCDFTRSCKRYSATLLRARLITGGYIIHDGCIIYSRSM